MMVRRARHQRPALVAAWMVFVGLLLLLVGCGPGVGGSGTGPEPSSLGPAPGLPVPSLHADSFDGSLVQAELESARLRVYLACPRVQFEGTWNGQAGPLLQFVGTLDGNPDRPATAEVQLIEGSLRVSVRDGSGSVLLEPVVLPSVSRLPPLGGCRG